MFLGTMGRGDEGSRQRDWQNPPLKKIKNNTVWKSTQLCFFSRNIKKKRGRVGKKKARTRKDFNYNERGG